ncbi:beta-glucosidase [Streptomyces sp. NPDC001493]
MSGDPLLTASEPQSTTAEHTRRAILQRLGGTAAAFAFIAAAGPLSSSPAAAASPTTGASRTRDSRVAALLRKLTLDEKLSLVHGATDPQRLGQAGYLPGISRLGIPELRLTDGPAGVNVARSATGLPPVSTLGATFNRELAREYGAVMGREGRALGMDVLLAPQIELSRSPLWSRNKDQSGEDPYLNGVIGAAQVQGIQAQGMFAQAKHFLANNQSVGQNTSDFVIDERTLHEIYLPAWEAVIQAGVASVMAAYNHINGEWNGSSAATLTDILRGELGFEGFVTSDWGATHSTSIAAGLDMQMPNGSYFGDPLKAAVLNGSIPESAVDTAVGRLLGRYDAFGLLDGSRKKAPKAVDVAEGARVAREVATQGAVLLTNNGGLPLSGAALADLALIGPTAGQVAVTVAGERAYGFEDRMVGPLDALRRTARNARIGYEVGLDLTGRAVPASAFPSGLTRTDASGATSTDHTVDFTGAHAFDAGTTATWTGTLVPPSTGEYALKIQGWGASLSLSLDGTQIATAASVRDAFTRKWSSIVPTTDGLDNGQTTGVLTGGRSYQVKITATAWAETVADRGPVQVRFAWVTPEQAAADVKAAVALARRVHTPVVFAFNGTGGTVGSTAETGSLALPSHQDDLITAVANANPRTVVVLTVGGPVELPWRKKVAAILHAGYTGQEGGWAVADLLLGRANPSGRVIVTYPDKLTDHPVHDPAHPERYQGVDNVVRYSEGVFTGYRGFDKAGVTPLMPFGHGLSYTRFGYSHLSVESTRDGGLSVSFTLTNKGRTRGAEVPQLYLGSPQGAPVELPVRALAAFDRIDLAPGASRRITLKATARQLSYWDTARSHWVRTTGRRNIYVGASSRDIRLTGTGR